MKTCPCGSEHRYAECCGRYIESGERAPTAEALMRARYTAYTQANIDFVAASHDASTARKYDLDESRRWAEESEWLGLEIVSTEAGGPEDTEGSVEFIARYRSDGMDHEHHEHSVFVKRDGEWYFLEGKEIGPSTVRRDAPKVGRNDPCPCGSGKKFKKCCGRG